MNHNKMFSRVFEKNEIEHQRKQKIDQQQHTRQNSGRMLWNELHRQAYNHNGTDDSAFIAKFGKQIPRFMTGCPCNEFWNKWIKENPPRYGVGEYFEWTVKCHNAVNIKLGKPIMSLEDARKTMQQ